MDFPSPADIVGLRPGTLHMPGCDGGWIADRAGIRVKPGEEQVQQRMEPRIAGPGLGLQHLQLVAMDRLRQDQVDLVEQRAGLRFIHVSIDRNRPELGAPQQQAEVFGQGRGPTIAQNDDLHVHP